MNTLNLGTTNQTPNLEDQRTLEDRELDAVTGGRILTKHPAAVTIPELKVTLGSQLGNQLVAAATKAAPEACLVARQEVAQGRGIFKFTLTMAGYNLIRLPKLIAAQA